MRHVGVEMVGGIEGLVLNTPSEDYRGQCLRQLLSEHITVYYHQEIKYIVICRIQTPLYIGNIHITLKLAE